MDSDRGPDLSLRAKFQAARQELSAALIERDDEIDLVLTALLCNEHPLLVGPPGTAKSLLLDAIMEWLGGAKFSILLTKFSTPEELFGPISVAGLKEDRYCRVTAGKLPEAVGCFIDEIWKASSAILNTLLRLLNERLFDRGDGSFFSVPLRICVAASNEWPNQLDGGKELGAMFDRFLLRKTVRPIVSAAGRQRLLWHRDHRPTLSTHLGPEELDLARRKVQMISWSSSAREAMETILRELAKEGIQPGDRRQHKAVAAVQAFVYLSGSEQVEPEHLEILRHILWEDPVEQPETAAQIIARIANPAGMRISQLLLETEQILSGSDLRQLSEAAVATTKLQEIDKQLAALKADARCEKARRYVREQIRKIRQASIDAI